MEKSRRNPRKAEKPEAPPAAADEPPGCVAPDYTARLVRPAGEKQLSIGGKINEGNRQTLFRLGIVSGLLCRVVFIFLVLVLSHLFKDIDKTQAVLMVTLVVVLIPIAFLNMLNQAAVLPIGALTALSMLRKCNIRRGQ